MNNKNTQYFKEKLLKEKIILEGELESIAMVNPNNPNDWSAVSGKIETDSADENEVADKFEELEENEIILNQLEPQFNQVNMALDRIENGTYGKCKICNEDIEEGRLEANPSAITCMKHMLNK